MSKAVSPRAFGSSRAAMAALLGVGIGFTGCEGAIMEPATPGLEEFTKVAEARTHNGNQVEFFEPIPGTFFVIEHASKTSRAVTSGPEFKGLGPVALYQKIAPGAEVPAALAQLQAQFDEALKNAPAASAPRDNPDGTTSVAPGSALASNQYALTSAEFRDKHCKCSWGTSFVCWRNVTGFARHYVEDIHYYDGEINAVRGGIRLAFFIRPWWSWERKASIDVAQNEEKSYHYGAAHIDYDAKSEVQLAEGDLYHYNGVGYNGPRSKCF
jgi:hypothetical protein